MVQAIIGQVGRNFEIIRAVLPDLLTVIIAAAFKSMPVVHVAWDMAFVTSVMASVPSSENLRR